MGIPQPVHHQMKGAFSSSVPVILCTQKLKHTRSDSEPKYETESNSEHKYHFAFPQASWVGFSLGFPHLILLASELNWPRSR